MKTRLFYASALVSLFAFNAANAQEKNKKDRVELDEVVIDSRFKIKKENSGKIVKKITPAMIERNKGKTVVDLINTVAGIEINGSTSSPGQNLSYFVRGGRSNEVVILIDGVQVVNPLQNNFDLRLLDLEQVESIEISKGASSTLYGSGAATAVISIRLKKAKEGAFNASVSTFLGTNQTQNADTEGQTIQTSVNVNGRSEDFNYLVSFSSLEANGFSAARDETLTQSFNKDGFRRNNASIKLGYNFSENFRATLSGNINNFNNSYDGGAFTDGNNFDRNSNYRIGFAPEYTYDGGSVHFNVSYNKYDIDRVKTSFPGKSNGSNYIIDAFVKHKFNQVNLIAGVNFQSNEIQTFSIPFGATELAETVFAEEPKSTITDPYANIVYISDFGLNINTGVRLNNHNKYGSHFVYNFNPSYRFTNDNGYTRIFGSYSTAFIAPSIQDLYASYGNVDLQPQESLTYEFGAEYKRNSFVFNAVYFNRDVENIIVFDSTIFSLVNGGDTTINGFELSSSYDILDNLNVNGNYTFTKNDQIAIRIPKNKINLGVSYTLLSKTNFSLDYQYVSDRDETDFRNFLAPASVTLDSYTLVDFSVNHELTKNIKVFVSATNLLNEDYQEVFGFSTRGRNYKAGIRFQF